MTLKDGHFLVERRISHCDFHEETVELSLRKPVGSLLLHWVLCCQDGEHLTHLSRRSIDGHLTLFHHFEQSGLRLRWRTVDFIHQNDVAEHRTLVEIKLARLHVEDSRTQHIAGHEVGRELDT